MPTLPPDIFAIDLVGSGKPVRLFDLTADDLADVQRICDRRNKPPVVVAPSPPPGPTDGVLLDSGADIMQALSVTNTVYLKPDSVHPALSLANTRGKAVKVWGNGPKPTIQGVKLSGCNDITLEGAQIPGGIEAVDTNLLTVKGCRIPSARFGVNFYGKTVPVKGLTVTGCEIVDCWSRGEDAHGIFVGNATDVLIEGNKIGRIGYSGSYSPGNLYMASRCHAVYVRGDCGPSVTVKANLVRDVTGPAIQLRSGGRCIDNWIADCPEFVVVGLVNGDGPVVPSGVSAAVRFNRFLGTRLYPAAQPGGKPQLAGTAIVLGNCANIEATSNTYVYSGPPYDQQGAFGSHVKIDRGRKNNGDFTAGPECWGVVTGNVGRGPFGGAWIHPRTDTSKLTIQQAWPELPKEDAAALRAEFEKRWVDVAAVRAEVIR